MTVGIHYPQILNPKVTMGKGVFRVEGDSDPTVRVPDVVFRCVGFIGEVTHEDSEGTNWDLCATGFFIAGKYLSPELEQYRMGYFVTAAHVAKDLSDKPICFLVNKRGGGVTTLGTIWNQTWWIHPDKANDVVVIPVGLQADADIKGVADRDFISTDDFESKRVGVGDEVLITGLFTEAPGQTRNMPIVRHGNIAMLPEEQLQTELGYADVYLIEARSIGGLSGSPVFVRSLEETDEQPKRGSVRGMKLLGIMHGHWDIKESELNKPKIVHNPKQGVNLGIGIVVPALKIKEILESPSVVEARMGFEKELMKKLKKSVPGTDSARGKKEEGLTQEQFESVLKKVTRKIEPSKK